MPDYEIRLLTPEMKPINKILHTYSSDDEAIQAGKDCAAGNAVEVWRDAICISRAFEIRPRRADH
jgi:hypothetical protein